MVAVHYQFFLNDAGVDIFDDWVALTASAANSHEGFAGAERWHRADQPFECHLVVRFQESTQLWSWSMSPEHIRVLERLDGFHLRPWRTTSFRLDPIQAS